MRAYPLRLLHLNHPQWCLRGRVQADSPTGEYFSTRRLGAGRGREIDHFAGKLFKGFRFTEGKKTIKYRFIWVDLKRGLDHQPGSGFFTRSYPVG
jgi:hypothetical protein